MTINEKKNYIILDDFKGNYAIAKYEVEDSNKGEIKKTMLGLLIKI